MFEMSFALMHYFQEADLRAVKLTYPYIFYIPFQLNNLQKNWVKKNLQFAYIVLGDVNMGKFSQFSSNVNRATEQDIRQKFDSYKDMSKPQLQETLMREVAKQKANGSFDYKTLESMVDGLQGMLSPQEYDNIRKILESLK